MVDYITEIRHAALRERRVLQSMTAHGTRAEIVACQRKRLEEVEAELAQLLDYYCLNVPHGAEG